ncbi:MAG: cation:proton antiporter [Burkholderia sp.]|nr:cation:proton antiporter [Burkholderia sp.]
MHNEVSLIALLAASFGLAMIFGYIASLLYMPPLVGYLLAGIVIGPATPGFVGNIQLAQQLAEVGVILLMFGVGLHFSLSDLLAVRRIALPGAIVQIVVATLFGTSLAMTWGWDIGSALVLGLSLSVASTVVLLRALEGRRLIESVNGRIAIGWLLVEDLVMIVALVFLPVLASFLHGKKPGEVGYVASSDVWIALRITLLKITAFIALMLIVGKRLFPRVLWLFARTGSRELFTLCIIAVAVGVAFGAAKLFDVPFALGAFFAGMMMRESEFSRRAADETIPLRDAFSVLFFISVGMLFDPRVLLQEPLRIIEVTAIVLVGKTFAAVLLVLAFRYPLNTGLIVGAGLAQIGEFSFILSELGRSLNLLSGEGENIILAVSLISIACNTILFAMIEPFLIWIQKNFSFARRLEARNDPLATLPILTPTEDNIPIEDNTTRQVVIVGYGRVGKRITQVLNEYMIDYIVIEQNREIVKKLREKNIQAVSGDAVCSGVLLQTHIGRAKMLVITLPDVFNVKNIIENSRALNPKLEIVLCTNSNDEAELFGHDSVEMVFIAEKELARGMIDYILNRIGKNTKKSSS